MKQNNGKNEINLRLNSSSSIILLLFCMFLLLFFGFLFVWKKRERERKREIRTERRILFYLFSVVLSRFDSKLCSIFLIYVKSSYYFLLISCVIWYFSELWRLNESWENERRDFSFTLFLIYYSFILLSRYFLLYVSEWFFLLSSLFLYLAL